MNDNMRNVEAFQLLFNYKHNQITIVSSRDKCPDILVFQQILYILDSATQMDRLTPHKVF